MAQATAYVIDAVRTPVGKRNGSLAGVHPIDLGVHAFRGIFERNDVDPAAVDDAIVGCVDAIGGQAGNIGRLTWLAAGYPEEVPGVTVDRQCGSSQQAISFGAQAIMAGTADLILAGGIQNMSQIPISSAMVVGSQFGFTSPTNESKFWLERYGDQEISQFLGADKLWVIDSSMHPQNDSIDIGIYFSWKPTLFGREDARFLKPSFGWFVNFIVATGDFIAFC